MTNLNTTPQVTPGHRLVPAVIQFFGEAARTVWVECPTWCVTDHVADVQLAVEDILHTSRVESLAVATLESPRPAFELRVQIKLDPATTDWDTRQAHIVVDDGCGEDAFLTPPMADELADRLVAFASQVRQLSRTARAHQQQAQVTV